MQPFVQVRNLKLELPSLAGRVSILRGIDAEFFQGERVAIVGPSGSGKSSLMMILAGLQSPTEGAVLIGGQDIVGMEEDDLAAFRRDHMGIVFQNFHLIPTMTALENVAIPLELADASDAFERASTALEQVGLSHRVDHYPAQLSGGEQQRTALARAIVAKPKLLLADEPTGNLDATTGEQIIALMFALARESGTTLLLITHDPALAQRCDRTLPMKDGLLQAQEIAA